MEDMYIVRDLHSEDIKNSYKNKKLKMTKDLNMHLCKDDIQMDNNNETILTLQKGSEGDIFKTQ